MAPRTPFRIAHITDTTRPADRFFNLLLDSFDCAASKTESWRWQGGGTGSNAVLIGNCLGPRSLEDKLSPDNSAAAAATTKKPPIESGAALHKRKRPHTTKEVFSRSICSERTLIESLWTDGERLLLPRFAVCGLLPLRCEDHRPPPPFSFDRSSAPHRPITQDVVHRLMEEWRPLLSGLAAEPVSFFVFCLGRWARVFFTSSLWGTRHARARGDRGRGRMRKTSSTCCNRRLTHQAPQFLTLSPQMLLCRARALARSRRRSSRARRRCC